MKYSDRLSDEMILQFKLEKLNSVMDLVRTQHPHKRGEIVEPSKSIIEEVRERLEKCSNQDVSRIALEFDMKRLMACIEIIAIDKKGSVAEKACSVLIERPKEQSILRGWFKLVSTYTNNLLEGLMRDLIEIKGFNVFESKENVTKRISSWFVSDKLSEGVFKDYQKSHGGSPFDDFLKANYLKHQDGLFREAWRELLIKGKLEDLKREASSRILKEFGQGDNAPYLLKFGQNYLNSLGKISNWNDKILEFIYSRYSFPRESPETARVETPFWRGVSEAAKKEFRLWLMLRHVESFFEGERADFWRDYVEGGFVWDVKKILGGEGFMLDFGRFGVVEFKRVGNAAYIYPKRAFNTLWNQAGVAAYNAIYFKDRADTVRVKSEPGWDGRILHFSGWQDTTRYRLQELIRQGQ